MREVLGAPWLGAHAVDQGAVDACAASNKLLPSEMRTTASWWSRERVVRSPLHPIPERASSRPGLLPAKTPRPTSQGPKTPVFRDRNVAQLAQLTTNSAFARRMRDFRRQWPQSARRRHRDGRSAPPARHAVAAISPTGSSTRMTVPSPELFSTSTVPP